MLDFLKGFCIIKRTGKLNCIKYCGSKGESDLYQCAKCFQRGCTKQDLTKTLPECPSKEQEIQEQAKELYQDAENHRIAYCAALTEAGGYCQDTRLIEIIKFLHRGGYHKIGLAFCTGLFKEAQEVVNILEYNGFEVVSIICKTAQSPKIFWASPMHRRFAVTVRPRACAIQSDRHCC